MLISINEYIFNDNKYKETQWATKIRNMLPKNVLVVFPCKYPPNNCSTVLVFIWYNVNLFDIRQSEMCFPNQHHQCLDGWPRWPLSLQTDASAITFPPWVVSCVETRRVSTDSHVQSLMVLYNSLHFASQTVTFKGFQGSTKPTVQA